MIKIITNLFPAVGVVAVLFMSSCKKADSDLSYTQYPVVESYLIPGQDVKVNVYYQKGLTDTSTYGQPVTGLDITVSDGTRTVALMETGNGVYSANNAAFVKSSGTYTLNFNYKGSTVSGSTAMPGKPGPLNSSLQTISVADYGPGTTPEDQENITLSWDNPGNYNHLVFLKFLETSKVSVSSFFRGDTTSSRELDAAKASSLELPAMTFRYLGRYRVVLARVNPEYLDMLQGSGMSSQNLTNPPSNLKNAFGIFTAMQTDTLTAPLIITR